MMFVDLALLPNEVGFVKVVQTTSDHQIQGDVKKGNSSLEITGFTDLNEALFKFTKGDLVQTFGVSLRYWAAKQTKNPANGGPPDGFAEGAYLLFPSKLHSDPYSRISSDVAYEQGKIIEQWTIKYFD